MQEWLSNMLLVNKPPKTTLYIRTAVLMGLLIVMANFAAHYIPLTELGIMFLIPVLYAAVFLEIRPALVTMLAAGLAYDFFCIFPAKGLGIPDIAAVVALIVFILVAIAGIILISYLKNIAIESQKNVDRLKTVYQFACELTAVTNLELLVTKVVAHIADDMKSEAVIFLSENDGELKIAASSPYYQEIPGNNQELAMAHWVYKKIRSSDFGKKKFPLAQGYYIPLQNDKQVIGVLGIVNPSIKFHTEQKILLLTMANLTALAIVRLRLAMIAQEIKTYEQSERLLTALFNSISHDMKTPLSSIIGAVSSLLESYDVYSSEQKKTLLRTIKKGSLRMNRVVGNLLDMARLESGHMNLNIDWCDMQDMIGVILRENGDLLREHKVKVAMSGDLPLIKVDYILIEQVLINILDNSVKYSAAGSQIAIMAAARENSLQVTVADQGNGIQPGKEQRIFDKFYRLQSPLNVSGTGLGLSICKGIIEAHNGDIWAESNLPQGTIITFSLPLTENK